MMKAKATNPLCVCLHFDINKTIIMSDVSSGKTIDTALNSILSECTWGIIPNMESIPISERRAEDWIVCHPHPSTDPPIPNALTFGTYLEDYTNITKKDQTRLKRSFTEPGCIGEQFRQDFNHLDCALKLDPAAVAAVEEFYKSRRSEDQIESRDKMEFLRGGYYHIIPSFFRAVEFLACSGLDFRIVFRTFGLDLANVCAEFNLFCEGKHPACAAQHFVSTRQAMRDSEVGGGGVGGGGGGRGGSDCGRVEAQLDGEVAVEDLGNGCIPSEPFLRLDGSDERCRYLDLRVALPVRSGKLLRTADGKQGLHLGHVDSSGQVSRNYNIL